jgi:hypothetical protein
MQCIVTYHFPIFQIKWLKGGKELDPAKFPITHTDGIITIEIINAQPGDSGKYKVVATNEMGSDASECVVIVEGKHFCKGLIRKWFTL